MARFRLWMPAVIILSCLVFHASAQELARPKVGDSFRDCENCPEMVVMAAGRFLMGSPENEEGRFANEGPQHEVTISAPFAVDRFAVTFQEWDTCVTEGSCGGYRPDDQQWGRGSRPVINVNWDDAQAYAGWLSKKTGKAYRLLSEAEREYVTRAGTTTPFSWGSSISTAQANYNGDSSYAGGPKGEFRGRTVDVKSFEPNSWGLYQVHGNIFEWTKDCWHDNYLGAPTDGSAWIGGDCSRRVLRGGAWIALARALRSATRVGSPAEVRDFGHFYGFRVARTLSH